MRGSELVFPRLDRLADRHKVGGLMADAEYKSTGMTYRDWLIGMAMQGMCANRGWADSQFSEVAKGAIKYADAVLDAMEKEGK